MPRFRLVFAVVAALVVSLMQWSTGPAHAQGDPVMCDGLVATIVGTDGDDVLQGTWQDDVIVGGAGNDTIRGASGADTICGGDGDDVIGGDSGADVLPGGPGNDTLRGQSQDDDVNGDDGDDDIDGDSGDDTLDGGNGFDVVDGSWGSDTCDDAETAPNCETLTNNGEDGSVDEPGDPILCDGLVATIVGTDGDDVLQGTWQDDVIVAGDGNDTINAGPGADTICAGPGDDVVNGESQNDSTRWSRRCRRHRRRRRQRHPTPTQWESSFNNPSNFTDGDKQLRNGFLALVAARYEPDLDRAQTLLVQSTLLLATHEQSGVQPYLEQFDTIAPSFVEAWFAELELGAEVDLETAVDPYDQLDDLVQQVQFVDSNSQTIVGGDPLGPAPAGNVVWDQDLLALDPTGRDPGQLFDAPSFDVEVGGTGTAVINVRSLTGVPAHTPPSWTIWQQANPPAYDVTEFGYYQGVRATEWWDWEERQWFLANLFRIVHTDRRVRESPAFSSLDSTTRFSGWRRRRRWRRCRWRGGRVSRVLGRSASLFSGRRAMRLLGRL